MKLEACLPLGKLDPGLRPPAEPLDLNTIAADVQLIEALGYDAYVAEESRDDPFVLMALAASATSRVGVGSSVALAFPRSPTTMAMSAWTLQKLSRGRFFLGLGSQVKAHIERRFGLPWSPAAPWMREYILAIRAVWDCWQHGTRLDFRGGRYRLNLMGPQFNPGPIEYPDIPIYLAAANPALCRVAGEVADGIKPHPVCTASYVEEVLLPAVREGAQRVGRTLKNFDIAMKPLVAAAPNEQELAPKVRDARARLAFYSTTPSYAAAFKHLGLGDLASEARLLAREARWEELPGLISDETLEQFAVIGTYNEIGRKLTDRIGSIATRCEFSIATKDHQDREVLAELVRELQLSPSPSSVANN